MSKKKDQEETHESDAPEVPKEETFIERLHFEHIQLASRLDKLSAFIGSPMFAGLDKEERERLSGQRTAMSHYLEILAARIAYHAARGTK